MTARSVPNIDNALPRYRAIQAAAQIERHAQTQPIDVKPNPRALPGDTRRLRGIPVIGRGVAGAIPGTRPDNVTRDC